MEKKLKILFVPFDLGGHVHSMIGLAKNLHHNGHQVLFFNHKSNEQLYQGNGLSTISYETNGLSESKYFEAWTYLYQRKFLQLLRIYFLRLKFFLQLLKIVIKKDQFLKDVIEKFEPDTIIIDDIIRHPSIICSGRPWVNFWSTNPLYLFAEKRPAGLESQNKLIISLTWLLMNTFIKIFHKIVFYWRGYGFERSYSLKSPFLNFYLFPQEVDYSFSKRALDKTFRLDASFICDNTPSLALENDLSKFVEEKGSNKIVLVSFGLLVSQNVDFMRKIVRIASRSKHLFIVAKGVNHDSFKLSRNMCGAKFVKQRQILPLVDLLITHGGNNSFTEAFYYGKPQIIIPFWTDQHDNAKRIHDFNLGIRINYNQLNEKSLLGAIEKLVNDEKLKNKLAKISARIRSEKRLDQARTLIEELV